jgi:hypothetical protein
MTSRMKAHWPERINPLLELRAAMRWLEQDINGTWHPCHTMSPAEFLGRIEAYTLIQFAYDAIQKESQERDRLRTQSQFGKDGKWHG